MKNTVLKLLMCGIIAVSISACSGVKTQEIDMSQDSSFTSAQLSDSDFEKAAYKMLTDLLENELASGKKGGGRYLMEVGEVKNDTQQLINVADLTDYIRKELRRSGKVAVTNLGENKSISKSRALADSQLINQATVQQKGTVYAADVSLFGRIAQRDLAVDKKYKKIEYIFSLSLTDLKTGMEIWSDKQVIRKITDKNTLTW